jgi:radical SAM protein with 4Fe4S-binding SPASM domain
VAWETTRACNLACRHCRAEAVQAAAPEELGAGQSEKLLRQIAEFPNPPMVILSGGEPLMRPDMVDLAALGSSLGLRMLLSTNGTLLTPDLAGALKRAGVQRVSLSLDHPDRAAHDSFRGQDGSFDAVMAAAAILVEAGLPFQFNSTITADNMSEIGALSDLAAVSGAAAHHVFLLVPVGRAADWGAGPRPAEDYEAALTSLKKREASLPIEFKATCAPQYNRIGRQLGLAPSPRSGRGCLGGQGFMFIGHDGRVGACGYLPIGAGHVLEDHPVEIYRSSPLFVDLRDRSKYRGRCRDCEFWGICGGCRARAHAAGDHLGSEPLCPHRPAGRAAGSSAGADSGHGANHPGHGADPGHGANPGHGSGPGRGAKPGRGAAQERLVDR